MPEQYTEYLCKEFVSIINKFNQKFEITEIYMTRRSEVNLKMLIETSFPETVIQKLEDFFYNIQKRYIKDFGTDDLHRLGKEHLIVYGNRMLRWHYEYLEESSSPALMRWQITIWF